MNTVTKKRVGNRTFNGQKISKPLSQLHVVAVGSREVGLIEKLNAREKGTVHPWKAFLLNGNETTPNTMLGAFYETDGGKAAAIAAIIARA